MTQRKNQLHITPTEALEFVIRNTADKWNMSISATARIALERQFAEQIEAVYQQLDSGDLVLEGGKIRPINGEG